MTTTNPEQWADDVRYLARLADWAAGEGFCHIKGLVDPDEWCFAKWDQLKPESNGDDYSADALAAALIASIQAAFAEREARLVGAAYREGWRDGLASERPCSPYRTDDDDWADSDAFAALAPFTKGQP